MERTSAGLEITDDTGELPLVAPAFDDGTLYFVVRRARSSEPIGARVRLTGEDEAVLSLAGDGIEGGGNETVLRRVSTSVP